MCVYVHLVVGWSVYFKSVCETGGNRFYSRIILYNYRTVIIMINSDLDHLHTMPPRPIRMWKNATEASNHTNVMNVV